MIQPTLIKFQQTASDEILPLLQTGSVLLIGATGTGKTYILSDVAKRLLAHDRQILESKKPFPLMYITASPVVPQTQQITMGEFGIKKIIVQGCDSLRATLGVMFIEWVRVNPDVKPYTQRELWEFEHISGFTPEEVKAIIRQRQKLIDEEDPYWRPEYMPDVIFFDESQKGKNEGALITKIMLQYIKQGGRLLLSSATPFARVSEGKLTSLALKPLFSTDWGVKVELNEKLWPSFAREIAGTRSHPSDFNSEAVSRLRESLEHRIVRLKGVRFDKKCHSHCKLIDFQSDEDRREYNNAYIEYLKILQSINREAPGGIAAIWVASQKFRQASELIRAPYLAGHAKFLVDDCNKQVCVASNFKDTLYAVKKNLLELGVPEDRISIIIGGQSGKERQRNITMFQTGKADYCLFTLKSGGVGLSLHHHKKNELTCKPRYIVLPPTWSAIEIVQAFGRPHRINSISDTYADIVWFRGTEEENVAAKLEPKLSCLQELIQKRETWMGVFSRRAELDEVKELGKLIEQESVDQDDEDNVEVFDGEAYSNDLVISKNQNNGQLVIDV